MFNKIKNKIRLGIILLLVLFVIIENIIIYSSIYRITYSNFINIASDTVSLSTNNYKSYLSLTTNLIDTSTNIPDLVNQVKTYEYNLNSLKVPSLYILGITLYDTNNNFYFTDGMGGIPTLSSLKLNSKINDFIDGDELSTIILRDKYIPKNYTTNINYDPNNGIISYICKIYNNNILNGFLFVDLNPKSIFLDFYNYPNNNNLKDLSVIISSESFNIYNSSHINNEYIEQSIDNTTVISKDKKRLIINNQITNDFSVISIIDLKNFQNYNNNTYLPIFILSFITIILSVFIGVFYSDSVVRKLIILNDSMIHSEKFFRKENK